MGAVEIAHHVAASRRAVRLYPPEHPAHREAVRDLTATVRDSIDLRPLTLNLHKGRLYEGSDVITDSSPATRALAEAMLVRRIESVTFHVGFTEVDATGLSEVLSLRPSPDLEVQAELDARDVHAVTVSELEDESMLEAEERDRRREADHALYRHVLASLRELTTALAEPGAVDPVVAYRSLVAVIERVTEDPVAVVALSTMTGHGERLPFHAVSVALHTLVIGHSLGMSDKELLALSLAGLIHDFGLTLPAEGGAEGLRKAHPVTGAYALGSLADDDCASMIASYEHHMGVDGSGWPEREAGHVTHPYSRIVAVADRYDGLVRPAEGPAKRPDQALAHVLSEATKGPLDPILARLFAQCLGTFPVGSAVRLADHSVGIVRSPGADPLRPGILLVLAADGTELRPPLDVELTDDERAVVEVIDTALLGIHPSDYL